MTRPQTISIIVYRLLVVLLLICGPQGNSLATVRSQTGQYPSQNVGKAAAAKRASDEASRLADAGSAQSLAAIGKYEEALQLYREIGDRINEGIMLNNLGFAYHSFGETHRALGYYNQALPVLRAAGERETEAATLRNLGVLYSHLGEQTKALDVYNQALLINRTLRDRRGEATALDSIGVLYSDRGEKQKALDYHNQALPIRRAVGDRSGEAITLNNIGKVYGDFQEVQKALAYYNQSLSINRGLGNRRGEAATLNNIAALYSSLGENQKALEYYSQALPIWKAVGDRKGEALTLIAMGAAYNTLGEKQKALEYYSQAELIVRALGDDTLAGSLATSVGSLYKSVGMMQKALEYHHLALGISRKLGDRRSEAITLNNIGAVYSSVRQHQKALDYYQKALPIHRAVGDLQAEGVLLSNIGVVYYSLGDRQKALEHYNQALPIRRAVGDRSGEADTLESLAELWAFSSPNSPAFGAFYNKQAVNVLQQLRTDIAGLDKELQKTFLKTKGVFYRGLAFLLMALGRLSEAQQALNSFKDQQFYDFNNDTQKQAASLTLTPREALMVARYEQITKRIEIAGRQLTDLKLRVRGRQSSADETTQGQQLQAQLKAASDEFTAFLKQAEAEFAKSDLENESVETGDTRELQSTLRELGRQTGQKAAAVYTFIAADRFWALVVTADNIAVASQPFSGTELSQKALQLWGLLQSDKYDPIPLAQELYSIVFEPIEAKLPKDTTTVLWSLDGNLRYLPMGALHDGKQYLIERYNHVVFTRADSERQLRSVSPRWSGLGLGSSEAHTVELSGERISFNALPGVAEELRALFRQKGRPGGVLDGEVLPDARFTKAAMLTALKQKRPLVHISSHFSFRPGDEARSFLLLGDGTAMTLSEMKQHTDLFSGVELLTLSACNTAAQQAGANGREIDGFAELAQRLGAGSVMATLWPVADNSTPWLMREFYQTRQRGEGLSKAEAFRRAQLALLNGTAQTKPLPAAQKGASSSVQIVIGGDGGKRDGADTRSNVVYIAEKDAPAFERDESKPFAHPYYWAPFILIGNWK